MYLIIINYSFLFIFVTSHAETVNIANTILNYFKSDNVRFFRETWKKQKMSYESAFLAMLRENYGRPGMNVYVRKMFDTQKIADAFYISDNILDVLMKDLYVVQLPILTAPEVDINLDSNVARFKGVLDKIIVRAKYRLFRNHTAVVFSGSDQNLHKTSPFSLQQVQNTGELSIIADGCRLTGLAIAKLGGMSVNLGHDTFTLNNCELNIEISTSDLGSPPIIAPYFSNKQGTHLEQSLSKPIRDELVPKLQAAMFSYINTSAIFGNDLPKFRFHQTKLFQDTTAYLRKVVVNYNKQTVAKGKDTCKLANKRIAWTEKIKSRSQSFQITITNVRLHGLDTAYLAQNGGPYQHNKIKIEDELRFNNLQVRGQINVESNAEKEKQNFGAELHDVGVNIVLDVDEKRLSLQRLEMAGWRSMELNHFEINSISSRSLLTGYLTNEIPITVNKHVRKMFADAFKEIDKKDSDNNSQSSQYENSKNYESLEEADAHNVEEVVTNNDEQCSDDNNKFVDNDEPVEITDDESNRGDESYQNVDDDDLNLKNDINKYYQDSYDSFNDYDSTVNSAEGENSIEHGDDIYSDTVSSIDYKKASHQNSNEHVIKIEVNLNKDYSETDDNSNYSDKTINSDEENKSKEKIHFKDFPYSSWVTYNKSGNALHQNVNKNVVKMKININKKYSENEDQSYDSDKTINSSENENKNKDKIFFNDNNPNKSRIGNTRYQNMDEDDENIDVVNMRLNINTTYSEEDDSTSNSLEIANSSEDKQRVKGGIADTAQFSSNSDDRNDDGQTDDSDVYGEDSSEVESKISAEDKRKHIKKNFFSEDKGN